MKSGAYDVLSEHQSICRLVEKIENVIACNEGRGGDWLFEIRPDLAELAAQVGPHFRGEEAEFFGDVRERLPDLAPTVELLVEQHQHLLQDFREVTQQAGSVDTGNRRGQEELVAMLSRTLKLLRAHEEQENELMLLAYWQDLGEAVD